MADHPKRKPLRLHGWDYSAPGAYFITVCTHEHQPLLWEVGAAISRPPLTAIGQLVETAILQIPTHYPAVSVDVYCIMPDHIHLLLSVHTDEEGRQVAAPTVSTVVGHMKRWVSKHAQTAVWQKSFVDHIIRSEDVYRTVWEYIENNPIKRDLATDAPPF